MVALKEITWEEASAPGFETSTRQAWRLRRSPHRAHGVVAQVVVLHSPGEEATQGHQVLPDGPQGMPRADRLPPLAQPRGGDGCQGQVAILPTELAKDHGMVGPSGQREPGHMRVLILLEQLGQGGPLGGRVVSDAKVWYCSYHDSTPYRGVELPR